MYLDMNIRSRALLIGSILLFGCVDSEYKNLKNDFGIRKIPCESVRYIKEGTHQGGLTRSIYFAIDCTADSLNNDHLKLVRRMLKGVLDTISLKRYTRLNVLFLKEGQTLREIEHCNPTALVTILSTRRHRFVYYMYANDFPNKIFETGYKQRGKLNSNTKKIELNDLLN